MLGGAGGAHGCGFDFIGRAAAAHVCAGMTKGRVEPPNAAPTPFPAPSPPPPPNLTHILQTKC